MEWSRYLKTKYPEIDPKILSQYVKADTTLTVCDDDIDLEPITLNLPKMPSDLREVDGFGLPGPEQKFTVPELPVKIKQLQKRTVREGKKTRGISLVEIYDILEENPEYYANEIKWIKKQWYYLFNGYWFFNNGKVTYIDGWHYFFCAFWQIDIGLPSYRDRDRKFFIFARFCFIDPRSYGFLYPKHRREGASNKASCVNYCMTFCYKGRTSGVQSMTEDHAQEVYDEFIIKPWQKLPFFFRPFHQGSSDPKGKLVFDYASENNSGGAAAVTRTGNQSQMKWKSSKVGAFDSQKLYFHHQDEIGKSTEVDVWKRHLVVKQCLSRGNGRIIHGLTIGTSTVGEMDRGGGARFKNMCDKSNYHKRNKNGQTLSGMYLLFLPAFEGLEGFIDEYGNSIVGKPTKKQLAYLQGEIDEVNKNLPKELKINPDSLNLGAKLYLEQQIEALREAEDFTALSETMRQFPTRYRDCWKTSAKDSGFDIVKIEDRIDILVHKEKQTYPFNLEYVDGKGPEQTRHPKVEQIITENGRFEGSLQFPKDWLNTNFEDEHGFLTPRNGNLMSFGSDTFKFNVTRQESRKSFGAGALFLKKNLTMDPPKKPMDLWESHRFITTYKNRPSKEVYGEDMLKLSLWTGVPNFPEINIPFLWDYYSYFHMDNFLFYTLDERGRIRSQPGGNTNEKMKQDIFLEWDSYVTHHIHRERHMVILNELKDIQGPDEMTKFDIFTAGGYSLVGAKDQWKGINDHEEESMDIGEHFRERTYNA